MPASSSAASDVAVVGGGPAGLAAAIACAQAGLSVTLLERGALPADKACGEGLLPPALRRLERLGVRALIDPSAQAPFTGLRYVDIDGTVAEAQLPAGGGLGVRRLALSAALLARAEQLGVTLQPHSAVRSQRLEADGRVLVTDAGELHCRLLVAADGLGSPLRAAAGLDRPIGPTRRFGMRRHYLRAAERPLVEIHVRPGMEAYLTPAGPTRLGVAFLWRDGAVSPKASFETLLSLFPRVQALVAGVPIDSEVRGAGPFHRPVRRRVAERLALIGDAAGYLDAITGEGLSLAFAAAAALGELAPTALAAGATAHSLGAYDRAYRRSFGRYFRVTQGMLLLARHPRLRRGVLSWLSRRPALFARLVALGLPD